MVRIAHISDSHLGCSLFQLVERREDARKCLQKAVDMAMRHDPDIIVHTGDVFDSPDPSQDDMKCAIEAFKSVEDRARVFVLQGNHDLQHGFRRATSPVRTLETAGIVKSTGEAISAKHHERIGQEEIDLYLISWARPYEIRRTMDSIHPSSDVTLLFSHDMPYDRETLPSTFDYIGFGHGHRFHLDTEYDIGRPGSTCIVDWRKEWDAKRKLIIVETSSTGNSYDTEALNDIREFKFVTHLDITGMGSEEAENYLKKQIDDLSLKKRGQPIVILQVEGTIDSETENAIRRADLFDYGVETIDPLFLYIDPQWQSLGPRPVSLSEPLNVRRSLIDYSNQTGQKNLDTMLELLDQIQG